MKHYLQVFEKNLFSFFGGRFEQLNGVEKLQASVLIHGHALTIVYLAILAIGNLLEGSFSRVVIFTVGIGIITLSFSLYRRVHHKYISLVITFLGLAVSFKADFSGYYPTRLLLPGLYISTSFLTGGALVGTLGFFGAIGLFLHGASALNEASKHTASGVMILAVLYGISYFFYRNMYDAYEAGDRERKVTKTLLEEISNILNHIKQGIFVFDKKLETVRKSRFLDFIVESSESNHVRKLLDDSSLTADQISQCYTVLSSVFNEDLIAFEANSHLLPRTMTYLNHHSLEIDWEPIVGEQGKVSNILVVVRDMTEFNKIKEEEKEKDRELKAISLFLGKSKGVIRKFIADADETYKTALLDVKSGHSKGALARNLHTIKGNARTLGLLDIATAVHNNETLLQTNAEGNSLVVSLEKTYDDILYYHNIAEKIYNGPDKDSLSEKVVDELIRCNTQHVKPENTIALLSQIARCDSLESILSDQIDSLSYLAGQLGKNVPVVKFDTQSIQIDRSLTKSLQSIFVHIFNNSLDHGIESVSERELAGKDPTPRIDIAVRRDADHLTIKVKDDGRGLDLEKLQKKANLAAGTSVEEAAYAIFSEGTSTKSQVTLVSGRGIGMSAVKAAVEELGGRIFIDLDPQASQAPMRHFQLRLQLPARFGESKVVA